MEVEAASFNTDTDSMSFGLIRVKSSVGIPSTMIYGELVSLLLNVPTPRIVNVGCASIPPWVLITERPGTIPCNDLATSICGFATKSLSTFTVETAPVRLALFCWP